MASNPPTHARADASRRLATLGFIAAALVLFFVIDLATDVLARNSIQGQSLELATREHLHYASIQLPGTAFLSLPYVEIGRAHV